MRRAAAPLALLLAPLLLAPACSPAADQPGAVTADEAAQLNEAAAMLDNDSVSPASLGGNAVQGAAAR